MEPPSGSAIVRRLDRLDERAFRDFVAALWRARGWSVTPADAGFVATREDPAPSRRVVRVTAAAAVRGSGSVDGEQADVVVTRRPSPDGVPVDSGPAVVDVADLANQIRYAVDAPTRRKLLDRLPQATPGPLRRAGGRLGIVPTGDVGATALRTAVPLLLATALVVAGLVGAMGAPDALGGRTVGAVDGSTPSPAGAPVATTTPHRTAVPIDAAGTSVRPLSDDPRDIPLDRIPPAARSVPHPCPEPPAGALPSDLRPRVGPAANRTSFQVWEPVAASSVLDFDPASRVVRGEPSARYTVTFRSPADTRFHLSIERWPSDRLAAATLESMAGAGHAAMVWGPFLLRVDGYGSDGRLLSGAAAIGPAYTLLAAVNVPRREEPLGFGCVTALAGDSPD